jgi:hypothetical protein
LWLAIELFIMIDSLLLAQCLELPTPSLGRQCFYDGDILQQFLRETVPLRLLYETQTFQWPPSQIRIFKRRSMALLRAASIRGVPALGLPKISSLVERIFIPIFSVSPLWSTSANGVTPLVAEYS